jgi:putative oxidoreductase
MPFDGAGRNLYWTAWVSLLFRLMLGGIFITAGLAKIADPVRYLFTLREFRLLPGILEAFLAVYLPWLEFILGLGILLGVLLRTSALLIAGLNGMFILAIGSVMVRGFEIDCGCFGLLADLLPLPDMADGLAVIRNLIFVAMGLTISRSRGSIWTLENYFRGKGLAEEGQCRSRPTGFS